MSRKRGEEGGSVQALTHWLRSVFPGEIPSSAIEQAKLLLLDALGCALAALNEKVCVSVLALTDDLGGTDQCTIIGRRRKTSPLNACLANGVLVRTLDLNDYVAGLARSGDGPEIGGHPSDNIPVALAIGEARERSGADVLASIVLGYEAFGRLKGLMDPDGVWDEVTVSGLVAPAMAGLLMDLDAERLAHALALGAARAATPAIVRRGDISAAKSIANALVAQSGLQSALLAERGVTGPLGVLDASIGMRSLFARGDAAQVLAAPFSAETYIMRSNVKTYPCLATGQCAVAAALKLRGMIGGAIEELEQIEVIMADYPMVRRQQMDPGRIRPTSREAADHSFNFLVAATLLDGAFGMKQYENERWLNPAIVALMEKLVMKTDSLWRVRAPGSYPCALRAQTKDGREHVAEIPFPPGFSEGGINVDAVVHKFHAVAADAARPSVRERIIESALSLNRASSLSPLMEALRPT